jgi:EXS family
MYYGAIVIDFLLRCTWSLKLSPHLDHFNDLEGGIFTMEVLEVFRRWMWIFFRVETEWGKLGSSPGLIGGDADFVSKVRHNRGPAPDDILLGEFNDKLDED